MNKDKLIKKVNKAWSWTGVSAMKIEMVNEFGNIIIHSMKGKYFRICPEELSCEKIADSEKEYTTIINRLEFQEDWKMNNFVKVAREKLGELREGEKYCLKVPAVIGGEYSKQNFDKLTFEELIFFSGDLASQIKNLKDGQKIELKIKN